MTQPAPQSPESSAWHLRPITTPQQAIATLADVDDTAKLSGLVWVPFAGRSGPALVEEDHELWGAPAPAEAARLQRTPPPTDIPCTVLPSRRGSPPGPRLYVPYWRFAGPSGEYAWLDSTLGEITSSSLLAHKSQAQARLLFGLALLTVCASLSVFAGFNLVTLVSLLARPFPVIITQMAGCAIMLIVWRRFFLAFVKPGAMEIVAEYTSPVVAPSVGPALGRGLVALGVVMLMTCGFAIVGSIQDPSRAQSPLFIALTLSLALIYLVYREPRAQGPTLSLSAQQTFSDGAWGKLAEAIAWVMGAAFFAAAVNTLLIQNGVYLQPMLRAAGTAAIESNSAESKLIAIDVIAVLAFTRLALSTKATLITALVVPLIAEPFIGPGLATVLQFFAVLGVGHLIESRSGQASGETLAHSLQLEIGLIAGSLAGRFVGIALVGTSGSTLGDIMGELIVGAIILERTNMALAQRPERPPEDAQGAPGPQGAA